ncbi:MAG TPA: HNH endonuclease [Terriglobia bacterium]|nr:HNH endonuclease [Terriglobia bacterium]
MRKGRRSLDTALEYSTGDVITRQALLDASGIKRRMLAGMLGPCIYCGQSPKQVTGEHVISAALGCTDVLQDCVCKDCNDAFGHSIEAPFINGLVFFRHMLRIPGRDGTVPDYKCWGRADGQDVAVTFTGDGRVEIPPQALPITDGDVTKGREYRVFKRGQDDVIENNLRRRHHELAWRQNKGAKSLGVVEVRAEFDSNILCTNETNRSIAKYALNLLTYHYGTAYTAERFASLRRLIRATETPSENHCTGIIWENDLFRFIQSVPPKHLLIVFADGQMKRVVVFICLFSLFPFCVVAQEPEISFDLFKSFFIDPQGDGKMNPLLVTRAFPEVAFSHWLATLPRGTAKQAHAAGAFAQKWILEESKRRRESDQHHMCYECGFIMETLTELCPRCGKRPLPDLLP